MSGWFPMDLDLQDKPEFLVLQAELNIDPDTLVGKLWKFWGWFDEQTTDGVMPRVNAKIVNARIGVQGFAEAMVEAGWLLFTDDGATMPGFEKRHSNSAKQRLAHAKRQAGYRKSAGAQHENGTPTARDQHAGGTRPAPTIQDNTIHTSAATKGSDLSAKQKAAAAAESKAFVKALPEDWKPAIDAVQSLSAKCGNWALSVAVQSGYSPLQVVEIVDIGKRHASLFKSRNGAIIDRLTTVGPEVPTREAWGHDIPPPPKPKPIDLERERSNFYVRKRAEGLRSTDEIEPLWLEEQARIEVLSLTGVR